MREKRARILGDIDPAQSLGLEIGALHDPLVQRADGRILYVDYAPTETLRENFLYPGRSPDEIVEVDIVWGMRPLIDCVGHEVDYVVASHVIEHVPDIIGWLGELHRVLRPGGLLGLAIPDRRNTFDFRRHVSTPGEMIEAHLMGYRRPSLRQVFDAAALSKDTQAREDWEPDGTTNGVSPEILGRMKPALALVQELATTGRYNDAHCWVFTPSAFLDHAEMLAALGWFPFVVEQLFATEPGDIEFVIRLRRAEDPFSPEIAASIAASRSGLGMAGSQSGEMPEVSAQVAALRHEIALLRGSTSWRMTSPLRKMMHWLGRR